MSYKKPVGGGEIYTAPTIQTIDLAVEQGIAISTPEFDDVTWWGEDVVE
ncbi:MAG: hypothetical protein IJD12_03075 [Tidjanibacter sp.]|nr:hypothetical protein [Tidjanibacter sp.]